MVEPGGARRRPARPAVFVVAHGPILRIALVLCAALSLGGCATLSSTAEDAEHGPDGTIAYYVQVECSEPGTKIEANGDYLGTAPLTVKIWGDRDGTFHNFGSYTYTIRALPVRPGQQVQTKEFRTGGWFTPEDMIPKRGYLDFGPAGGPATPAPQ